MIPGQIPNGKGHLSEKKQDSSSHVSSRRHLNKKLAGELREIPDCNFILCVNVMLSCFFYSVANIVPPFFLPSRLSVASEREFNPDIHCGVVDMTTRKTCTRSLTCKVKLVFELVAMSNMKLIATDH